MGDNPAHRADDGGRESGYLDSEEAIAEYLSLAARDENPGVLLKALGDVARARGMA